MLTALARAFGRAMILLAVLLLGCTAAMLAFFAELSVGLPDTVNGVFFLLGVPLIAYAPFGWACERFEESDRRHGRVSVAVQLGVALADRFRPTDPSS